MGNGGGVTCDRQDSCKNVGKYGPCAILVDEPCGYFHPSKGFASIPMPHKYHFLLKQRHSQCADCLNHPNACRACVQNDEPDHDIYDGYDIQQLKIKAEALDALMECQSATVFGALEALQSTKDQSEWAAIIVRATAKSTLEIMQEIHK